MAFNEEHMAQAQQVLQRFRAEHAARSLEKPVAPKPHLHEGYAALLKVLKDDPTAWLDSYFTRFHQALFPKDSLPETPVMQAVSHTLRQELASNLEAADKTMRYFVEDASIASQEKICSRTVIFGAIGKQLKDAGEFSTAIYKKLISSGRITVTPTGPGARIANIETTGQHAK